MLFCQFLYRHDMMNEFICFLTCCSDLPCAPSIRTNFGSSENMRLRIILTWLCVQSSGCVRDSTLIGCSMAFLTVAYFRSSMYLDFISLRTWTARMLPAVAKPIKNNSLGFTDLYYLYLSDDAYRIIKYEMFTYFQNGALLFELVFCWFQLPLTVVVVSFPWLVE